MRGPACDSPNPPGADACARCQTPLAGLDAPAAAGPIEAMAAIMAVRTDTIHPTINYHTPDPTCDLDYVPNVARNRHVNIALSNSFGFGGQNACLVVGKYPAEREV